MSEQLRMLSILLVLVFCFRLLKVLAITDSQIPNLGTKTLILLGSLRVLDLSRNRLTALIDKNFEGLHSLKVMMMKKIQSLMKWTMFYCKHRRCTWTET